MAALPVWKRENGCAGLEAPRKICICRHMSELMFLPCLQHVAEPSGDEGLGFRVGADLDGEKR